jgi:predicted MFS family arabinose efflux permease
MAMAPISGTPASGLRTDFSRMEWVALLFVVCCGFSSQMVMPLWVAAVIEDLGLSEAAAGRIGSFEFMAVAIVSVLVALRIRLFPTRITAAIGVLLLVLGNLGSAWATQEGTLIAFRMLCGIGKGLVVAITFSLVAGSARPTRAFAVLNVVYGIFSTIFYLTIPLAIRWDGAHGAFLGMAIVAIAGALFMPRFPAERLVSSDMTGLKLREIPKFGILAFVALIILWSGHNVIWTFIARIGSHAGMSVTQVGSVLSLSAFLTIAGPGLVRAIDTRLGYGTPMMIAILLKIVAVLMIGYVATAGVYSFAVPAFMLLSLFITPYVMGILSLADPAGRLAAASSAAMTAGASAGAYLGGLVLGDGSYVGLAWMAVAHFVVFTVIVFAVSPLANRHAAAATAG